MYQAQNVIQDAIPHLDAGIVGDGMCDIKPITIITVQSATSAFSANKKDVEKNRKVLKESAEMDEAEYREFKKENLTHVSEKREDIIKLIETTRGIYCDECLVSGTRVIDKNGFPIKIENIKNSNYVYGGKVTNKFSRGVKNTILIEHGCGKLQTTRNHFNGKTRPTNMNLKDCPWI